MKLAPEPQIDLTDRSTRKKIIVIGEPRVGKTTLINKYVKVDIVREYMPTVGASISKQLVCTTDDDGHEKETHLLIWDIGGQHRFSSLHKVYYKGAQGIIIMFDLTDMDSFEKAKLWYAEVAKYFGDNLPVVILAGNKKDLDDERQVPAHSVEQAKILLGIEDYLETSALNGENVEELFQIMADRLLEPFC